MKCAIVSYHFDERLNECQLVQPSAEATQRKNHVIGIVMTPSCELVWVLSKISSHILPTILIYYAVIWKGENSRIYSHRTELANTLNNFPVRPTPPYINIVLSSLPSLCLHVLLSFIDFFDQSSSQSLLDLKPRRLILDKKNEKVRISREQR